MSGLPVGNGTVPTVRLEVSLRAKVSRGSPGDRRRPVGVIVGLGTPTAIGPDDNHKIASRGPALRVDVLRRIQYALDLWRSVGRDFARHASIG